MNEVSDGTHDFINNVCLKCDSCEFVVFIIAEMMRFIKSTCFV
jgi:hypothetical protein